MRTFQEIVATLSNFWASHGCIIATPYDLEKGAGTSNPTTFLRALGPEPYNAAYIEPCRRPKDGRYGENPNRLQHYFQYQVILKPSPDNILELYLESLKAIGMDISQHDIRFVHDDWENPTLGAWGLGWEVWINGMEMTQFTYFQAVAGIPLSPITGEITYGIERIAMCLQGVNSIFDIQWNQHLTYGDIYKANEIQWSEYNFEAQDAAMWARHFTDFQSEAKRLVEKNLPIPAYDFVVKASHAFNMLDAKGVISVTERAHYIAAIRDLAKRAAEAYLAFREQQGFPLTHRIPAAGTLKSSSLPTHQPSDIKEASSHGERGDLIIEIGVEELPATFVPIGISNIEKLAHTLFERYKISYTSLQAFGTPRRLSLFVRGLQTSTPVEIIERRGPRIDAVWDAKTGNLLPAGKGFFSSLGLQDPSSYPTSLQEIEQGKVPGLSTRAVKGADYLFFSEEKPSQPVQKIIMEEVPHLIRSMDFPKMMRWGNYNLSFARPIRWLLAMLDSEVIPFELDFLIASNITYGNRQLTASKPIQITHASEYEARLADEGEVIVDHKKRSELIHESLHLLEERLQACSVEVAKVMKQVTHLVEKPFVEALSFDPAFLEAPREVLISEMVEHQKYFPLESRSDGSLLPHFVIVSNRPVNAPIEEGNKKVLSARLFDGTFLWKEDRKTPLQEMREKLHAVTYQKGAGSVYDKTKRIRNLALHLKSTISPSIDFSEHEIETTACLSKADLTSNLVGEFPELQGIVGMHLARYQNLPESVATAIRDHWFPNQEEGPIPSTGLGSLISIADKLDSLAIFFCLGLKPTSSSDPYALRRAAMGIVRILIENTLSVSLSQSIHEAITQAIPLLERPPKATEEEIVQDIAAFILARARAYAAEKGYSKECIDTVLSEKPQDSKGAAHMADDLYDAFCRLEALASLKNSPEQMKSFIEVMKRCIGQVDTTAALPIPDRTRLQEQCEILLFDTVERVREAFLQSEQSKSWNKALEHLLSLQKPIDTLFSEVKVLSDNVEERQRRLGLLQAALELVNRFGDMKRFVGLK